MKRREVINIFPNWTSSLINQILTDLYQDGSHKAIRHTSSLLVNTAIWRRVRLSLSEAWIMEGFFITASYIDHGIEAPRHTWITPRLSLRMYWNKVERYLISKGNKERRQRTRSHLVARNRYPRRQTRNNSRFCQPCSESRIECTRRDSF